MNPLQAAVWTLLIYVSLASPLAAADTPATSEATDQRCGGEPCAAVFRGLFAFFDRNLHGLEGNGRSCADCHMATEQFRLTPAAAETRFQLLQKRRQRNPYGCWKRLQSRVTFQSPLRTSMKVRLVTSTISRNSSLTA